MYYGLVLGDSKRFTNLLPTATYLSGGRTGKRFVGFDPFFVGLSVKSPEFVGLSVKRKHYGVGD